MDELLAAISVAGEEVDLVARGSANPGGGGAAAFEFEQDERFKRVADVGASGLIVEGDERGVDGVGFARIDHALTLGAGLHPNAAHEEGILQVGEEVVQGVFGHGHALCGEEVVDLLHAERTACISSTRK